MLTNSSARNSDTKSFAAATRFVPARIDSRQACASAACASSIWFHSTSTSNMPADSDKPRVNHTSESRWNMPPCTASVPPRYQTTQATASANSENNPQRCRKPAGASPESLTRNGPTRNSTHTAASRMISGTISEAVPRICSIASGTVYNSESTVWVNRREAAARAARQSIGRRVACREGGVIAPRARCWSRYSVVHGDDRVHIRPNHVDQRLRHHADPQAQDANRHDGDNSRGS